MRFCIQSLWLVNLALSTSLLLASPITVSYTQYFDYNLAGIVGNPSATWTATFDPALEPTNPFPSNRSSVNTDFILAGLSTTGAPGLLWQGGDISGAAPASFTFQGVDFLVAPCFPLFPSCSLPCSAVATHPDQAFRGFTQSFFDLTPDRYVGVEATPEPVSRSTLGLGLLLLAAAVTARRQDRVGGMAAVSGMTYVPKRINHRPCDG